FKESSTNTEKIKFDADMTAFNIKCFTGLKIQWTDNLANHLQLIDNEAKLCIFHHVTFLKWQIKSPIFPSEFIKETLQTLALLFPRYGRNTQKWLHSEFSSTHGLIYIDCGLLNCDSVMPNDRAVEKFKFWRDELLTMNEKFDEPRPISVLQLWHDRRKKLQWFAFWIAVLVLVLTIFFGLVQSIEGTLQVYKAYYPTSN
ncbi:hypothetical protein CC78DRAFT_475120, partial [Lojkania enalia]